MRRFAMPASVALLLVGVELATRGVSLTVSRVVSGFSALANGLTLPVSTLRFVSGVVLLFVGVLATLMIWWVGRVEDAAMRVGERCPSCGGETHRVKRNRMQKALTALVGESLAGRRCGECGWTGLSMRY